MANYNYLVEDIVQTTENDSTELADNIPKIVNRAEERLTRDLDDYGLVSYTSVAVPLNNNIVTLPTGTRIVKNFNIVSDGTRISLLQRTDEYIRDYWPVSSSTGTPKYYAPRNGSTVLIAPTPVSTFDGEVVHISRPVSLSPTEQNNYFSDFCYDALFNACMVETNAFQKDYSTAQLYEVKYQESLNSLRNQARRTRRDDMEVPASPAGADDNLIANTN